MISISITWYRESVQKKKKIQVAQVYQITLNTTLERIKKDLRLLLFQIFKKNFKNKPLLTGKSLSSLNGQWQCSICMH